MPSTDTKALFDGEPACMRQFWTSAGRFNPPMRGSSPSVTAPIYSEASFGE
jgi:hypothetical protein